MLKIYLRRVRLNQGGYDSSGTYWGVGKPLYFYFYDTENDYFGDHLRAYDREDAKAKILSRVLGQAKFAR